MGSDWALAIEIEACGEIIHAATVAREVLFSPCDKRRTLGAFAPHLPLLYGSHNTEELLQAFAASEQTLDAALADNCELLGVALVVMMTYGDAHWCWKDVIRIEL